MENERLTWLKQVTCDHAKQERYVQRCFDILNGFELVETKCVNCHKILSLKIEGFGAHAKAEKGNLETLGAF